jgi:TPR repeat protein
MGHKQTWRCLAANQADAEVQHNLGLLHAQGQGVPQEYAEAPSGFTSR